jgi:integrase
VPRQVPIHPTLVAILAEWKLDDWAAMIGGQAEPDDLVVPLPRDERQLGGRVNPRDGGMRNKSDSFKRLRADLETLGLRHRRGHDLRRTFITLCQLTAVRATSSSV